ncbi:DUF1707 domain-containing protein [Pseudonocardia alni]|mgnify:CR=1 FL=1|uniref:Uncharacterized protein DUF1707 n=2 Tax=Pseudonocardia alni TaxID=33907 RepID=A0A852WB75_PSEA5|nr:MULTISPECIES: DUF1707 domain-containing protein [Pseudonocardia]NWJ74541.1 DUF1707 domain-containing protein [Pseudonocardia pini]OJG08770.1 hypothetical protein BG618_00183 [Pseudonocardia autotrophica]MBO4236351.1 DUF1707 domain-containing protein [Pseudonocardia alni]MCM3845793.1 DUF1707 domain-containing protein [Pseudonocardia sp. DR1-2]MCO7192248.1 DUF1707 domain-containing protein [Pseudonocardia sp. McavD-2-B]
MTGARLPGEGREIRISDADRERAATRLNRAMAEGRISVEELQERLSVVYGARFGSELLPVLSDLPGDPLDLSADVLATPVGPPTVLRGGVGGVKRRGDWAVPARLRVQTSLGAVLLDFCDAQLPMPVVEVELELGAGSARLLVPENATADVDGLVSQYGSVRSKMPSRAVHGRPHFRVYGRTAAGSVTVRTRYTFAGRHF